jgi:hypothetical protein
VLFALLFFAATHCARAADSPSVGMVSKVANDAEVVTGDGTLPAVVGTVLHSKDTLRTGAGGRMEVTFRDNTLLTLGENANVVIDKFVFDPDAGVGEAALNVTQGAFRFATGRIGSIKDKKVTVSTPVAQIGVRGTEFWGGAVGAKFGVLLLKPAVTVSNQAGSVALTAVNQGTEIASAGAAPSSATIWSALKREQALGSTTFQPGNQQFHDRRGENQNQGQGQTQTDTTPPANTGIGPYAIGGVIVGAGVIGGVVAVTTNSSNGPSTKKIKEHDGPGSP